MAVEETYSCHAPGMTDYLPAIYKMELKFNSIETSPPAKKPKQYEECEH